jgi:hypothetical protein
VIDSKKIKANKPKETGSQEKPDYQAPRSYEHLLLMGPNAWAYFALSFCLKMTFLYYNNALASL